MNKEERGRLFNRIYDDFIKLIKGEINKVVVSQYEVYELDSKKWFVDGNYQTVRFHNYADVLRDLIIDNGISQTKDMISGDFIFWRDKE